MTTPANNEAERKRKQAAQITKHYRAIGPAGLVAALLVAKKRPVRKTKAA